MLSSKLSVEYLVALSSFEQQILHNIEIWLWVSEAMIYFLQVMHLDAEKEMMSQCVVLLGKFISVREPNIRYLGLVRDEILTLCN